jgi:hypothetical protein
MNAARRLAAILAVDVVAYRRLMRRHDLLDNGLIKSIDRLRDELDRTEFASNASSLAVAIGGHQYDQKIGAMV